ACAGPPRRTPAPRAMPLATPPRPPAPGWPSSARTCSACCWPNSISAYNRSRGCWPPCAPPDHDAMTRYLFPLCVFLAGLAAAGWIAAGYAGGHLLALCVTLLIVAFYLAGALELYRY